ncbi:MAG: hypothetical protein LBI87_00915 [Candidatus Accumulibacter sp.]|jgi:hypothetical protein|nr:hypothetical protein [Accumulibacter sp.]
MENHKQDESIQASIAPQDRPIYVRIAPSWWDGDRPQPWGDGEDTNLFEFLWFIVKTFGFIAQKLNPFIAVGCFLVSTLIAHNHGFRLWSFAIGLAVAIPAWFIAGGLIYWSIVAAIATAIGYLLYLFFLYIAH